jgi:hypothetical protein
MLTDVNSTYWGTILKEERYMQMLASGWMKTAELKPEWTAIPEEVTELAFVGNSAVRRKFKQVVVSKLMDREALGPFRSGREVLEAETAAGLEFKSGLSEAELDAFIAGNRSGKVYVYRVCDARTTDEIVWHHSKENNVPGFLRSTRKTDGGVRFEVSLSNAQAREKKRRGEARALPKVPKRARVVIDLTLTDD